jgi:predicted MPP superfamily phosphohydrolase
VLTGDFVSEGPMPEAYGAKTSYPCAEILAGIHCPQRWSVLGNHDAVVGPKMVTDALETHGLPVLANAHVPFERNGARLWIAGVKDIGMSDPDLHLAAPHGLQTANEPVILLGHEPDYADRVFKHGGVDLMLAGHSHGGQVRLPLVGALYTPLLGRKYVEGLFHLENGLQLYVNRGIGTVGVPLRLDCRPELTLLTLRSTRT